MADKILYAQFIAEKVGKTGLTVTVDVDKIARADGTRTAVVTAASATEGRNGWYLYRVANVDEATYDYIAVFKTADDTVDQQQIAALRSDYVDQASLVTAIWAALTSALTTVGSIGKLLVDNINATISSRSTLAAGAQMDLVNAPNATAITAIQSGLATAAKLLNLVKSLARKDATVDSDIGGTYVTATDSLEALSERITSAEVTITDAVSGSELNLYRGTTWDIDLTVGDVTGNSKLWFTVKDDANKDDDDAVLQVERTAGLVRFNGAAGTSGDATLVENNAATGDITITVKPATTQNAVVRKGLVWDVKVLIGTVVSVKARGTLNVSADVTRSIG